MAILRSICSVVAEADNFFGSVFRFTSIPGMVLEGKLNSVTRGEVGGFAAELPDEIASLSVDFLDCIGITC